MKLLCECRVKTIFLFNFGYLNLYIDGLYITAQYCNIRDAVIRFVVHPKKIDCLTTKEILSSKRKLRK